MKKILKYGLVSLSLLTLGLSVTTTDLPVVGVQVVSASAPGPGAYSVDRLPKVTDSSTSSEIKAALDKAREFDGFWKRGITRIQSDLEYIEVEGILPASYVDDNERHQKQIEENTIKLALANAQFQKLVASYEAKLQELERFFEQGAAGLNGTEEEKEFIKQRILTSEKQKFDEKIKPLEEEAKRLAALIESSKRLIWTVDKLKEERTRNLPFFEAEGAKVAERLAELEKLYASALKREAKEEALRQLTSQTHPIAVTVGKADAGKIKTITTQAVTRRSILAKLPSSLKASQVSLYDIKVIDGAGQVSQISEPATVTLPVDAKRKVLQVIYFLPETGAIEDLAFTLSADGKSVSFTVTHFSHYGVVYEDQATDSSTSSTSTLSSDNSTQSSTSSSTNPTTQGTTAESSTQPSASNASVKVADTETTEQKVLPKTGEQSTGLSLIAGLGLLLSGFGLKHYRKKD